MSMNTSSKYVKDKVIDNPASLWTIGSVGDGIHKIGYAVEISGLPWK